MKSPQGACVFATVCFTSLARIRTTALRFPACYDNVNVARAAPEDNKRIAGERADDEY